MYRTYRIGLAIDTVGSYGRGVIRGVMEYCRSHPYLVVSVEPFAAAHVSGAYAHIQTWDVDGFIVQFMTPSLEEEVLGRALPAVNVSNVLATPARVPTVVPDDERIGTMAAKQLLALNPRAIGYFWPGNALYGRLRLAALRREVQGAGFEVHECDLSKDDPAQWLSELPKPAAVLGSNDQWAHHLMNIARRAGVAVPDELAVLGVDDDELHNMLVTPSLSSIQLPTEQIGATAAEMLDEMMRGKSGPAGARGASPVVRKLAPKEVVSRGSTDVLSLEDPEVQMALRFIRDHAVHPLCVGDLLDHVPLSRRTLERRFRSTVGRSLQEEICRVRLEKAKQLLGETDLPMPKVARGCGFNSENRFGITFRKVVGIPPTEFRRRERGGKGRRK